MGPSPARSGKHEDMLRLMLSLESIASIVSEKEETADEVADEWEERFAVWQAQLKDLSRLLHETSSQLEAETQRADIAETTLRTLTERDAKIQQEYGRVVELLKIALSWQPGQTELKTQMMTNGRLKQDFSDLNLVALKRLKSTTSMEEQLRAQTDEAKKYKKGFESLQFQHELLQAQLKGEIALTTKLKLELKRNPSAEKVHELEEEIAALRMQIKDFKRHIDSGMLKGNEFNFFLKPGRTVTSDDSKLEGHGLLFIVDGTQRLVKQGTSESLVDYLINSETTDITFLQTFILSHRLFIESPILLNMLTTRFRQQAGNPSGKNSLAKVINSLKYWVEHYFDDFAKNEDMLETLNYLLEEFSTDSSCKNLVNMLASTVTRKLTGAKRNVHTLTPQLLTRSRSMKKSPMRHFSFSKKTPDNISTTKNRLLEFKPEELAQQLTLMDFEFFSALDTREFLELSWMKSDKEEKAPTILKLTRWTNKVAFWIVSEILSCSNLRQRSQALEACITIVQILEELNNWNGVVGILGGLNSSPIFRLRKTKELLSSKAKKTLERLKVVVSSEFNYKSLRFKMQSCRPPLIPYIGIYQGDLVFLDTIGKNFVDKGMVNFQKLQKMASYVLELKSFQDVTFPLTPQSEIQDYIRQAPILSENAAYETSVTLEP